MTETEHRQFLTLIDAALVLLKPGEPYARIYNEERKEAISRLTALRNMPFTPSETPKPPSV